MGSLRGLRLAAGTCFRLYGSDVSSSLSLTRTTALKRMNGFCTKPQESPKAPSHAYSHGVPLHKPTDWERKILVWSGRFKKEEEIPETISFEMLDAAKNRIRVKISYLMIVLTVAGCIFMVIEGKKAARRHESLTSINLEKKARLREEALREAEALKAKAE
ncbi:protein FAM162A [Echinops telfairi]|uniref:Protein FAM162A n=1 Tax=Echinops telfairi TaxID=9371 RepID=A0AC55CVJ7_ECHTE|nr:protein FAM162A [Echinops telfairi]